MAETTGGLSAEHMHVITWEIRDFFRKPANVDSCLFSPSFSSAKAHWRLELYPNGRSQASTEGHVDVFLMRLNSSIAQHRIKATLSLSTSRGVKSRSVSFNKLFDKNLYGCGSKHLISRSCLRNSMLQHFLLLTVPDCTLTVHCEIIVKPSSDNSGASEDDLPETDFSTEEIETGHIPCTSDTCKRAEDLTRAFSIVHKLQSDYKKLLETEEDSDVCLKVYDKEFRAHKCILRARSSVFSAMFQHDMQEKNSGEVIIEDLDSESFTDFLQHMYAGSLDNLSEKNVFNLYTAADKHDMTDLKSECKRYIKNNLSVETFCDAMILALRFQEDELIKFAADFFCKNVAQIIVTVKWQGFSKDHNTAANELLIKAIVPAYQK